MRCVLPRNRKGNNSQLTLANETKWGGLLGLFIPQVISSIHGTYHCHISVLSDH